MNGFTLIETLVALAIAAAVLAVLYGLFGGNLAGLAGAEASSRATVLAQSRLEAIGLTRPLRPGTETGRIDDRFSWREDVRRDTNDPGPVAGWLVRVTILWTDQNGDRSVWLDSVRLAANP